MKKLRISINDIWVSIASAFIRGVGVGLFLLPNSIVSGGVLGISTVLQLLLPYPIFNAAYWLVFINIPLLIISFFKISKRWTILTGVNVVFTALFIWVVGFAQLPELLSTTVKDNRVLYAIIGGALSGLALPLMLSIQGSTGGSDVIAILLKKKSAVSVMRNILYFGFGTIVVGSLVLQNFDVFVYSVVALFASEVVEELVFRGYSAAISVEIVTDHPEEMAKALMDNLKHGVTAIRSRGMYTGADRTMILCIVSKRQVTQARKIIRMTDPKAFAYMQNVREVVGLGFVNKEEDFTNSTDEIEVGK